MAKAREPIFDECFRLLTLLAANENYSEAIFNECFRVFDTWTIFENRQFDGNLKHSSKTNANAWAKASVSARAVFENDIRRDIRRD